MAFRAGSSKMNDEKMTLEKPALKVFSIDDTAFRVGEDVDGYSGSLVG